MSTYVYGITPAELEPPDLAGLGGEELRLIVLDELAAVVSTTGDEPLRATSAGLKAHTRVLDALAAETTVLPLRFGTVLADDDAVIDEMLTPNVDQLQELLENLDGHVQLTVKVFSDEDQVVGEIVKSDPRIARLWKKVQGVPPAAAYYDRIELGQQIHHEIQARRDAAAEPLFDALAPLAAGAQAKKPAQDLIILDADFLVERDRIDEFDAEVDALAKARPELQFRYLGPMPVYSFADLVLEGA